jgi:hypothetical protein
VPDGVLVYSQRKKFVFWNSALVDMLALRDSTQKLNSPNGNERSTLASESHQEYREAVNHLLLLKIKTSSLLDFRQNLLNLQGRFKPTYSQWRNNKPKARNRYSIKRFNRR